MTTPQPGVPAWQPGGPPGWQQGWAPSGGQGGPPPQDQRRRGSRAIKIGVILMIISIVGGVALTAFAFIPLFGSGAPTRIEQETRIDAEAGETLILYAVNTSGSASDCLIRGPDESPVQFGQALTAPVLTLNNVSYRPTATVEVAQTGTYLASCDSSSAVYAIGRELPFFRSLGLGLTGIFGGISTFFVGVIVLIIGVVQKTSASKAAGGPVPFSGR